MARLNNSGPGATVSASGVPESLVEAFDEWWEDADYQSRSAALRDLMRDAIDGHVASETPLPPPKDDELARGYRRLVRAANADGIIRHDSAKKACTNGPLNLSKQEVVPIILEPLDRRGYLVKQSNVYGHISWKIAGWYR